MKTATLWIYLMGLVALCCFGISSNMTYNDEIMIEKAMRASHYAAR